MTAGAASAARDPVLVDLALQGGGSHGAFTWGVLDRLMDEPWLRIDGASPAWSASAPWIAHASGIDPALMHRIAVIGSGTLDSLPHNGAVVTLLAVCGSTHRKSYFDMVMANIVGPIIALVVVIALGSMLGSF